MYHIYLGLGSNVGAREVYLAQAVERLQEVVRVTAVSPIYETAAWGMTDQADFLNMAVAGRTDLPPPQLLRVVKSLEVAIGRKPRVRWGPREIDIDILLYEELIWRSEALDVPHVGMAERASVLVPMADIAADLHHPYSGLTIAELARTVETTTVQIFRRP